jgi:phytoene dehydrogenase-like protein
VAAESCDVLVIGAGFGGLGAALTLAEAGAEVVLCEAMSYPGGCASTFSRRGWRFEAGATLFSGFGPDQVMRRWIDRHRLPVEIDFLEPVVTLRAPGLELAIPGRRGALVERLCALPGAPAEGIRAFFEEQRRVADALWELLDDPALLPPLGPGALLAHARRSPRYLPLLRLVGRPLASALWRHGLLGFEPLRIYLDAVCQITVQASAAEAEAPFAMGAMDYYFRGTGHVRGGVGALASGLVGAVRGLGGRVHFADRVKALSREGGGWRALTRKRELRADAVVANLLPQSVRGLCGLAPGDSARLDRLSRRVEGGWGAAMLYLGLRPDAPLARGAHHLELVQDPARPFTEGNHLFCSVSDAREDDRGPGGARTATVSTHVPIAALRALSPERQGAWIAGIQEQMWRGLQAQAPELAGAVVHRMTASPRTFARFTRRPEGYVGGVPRLAGLHNYAGIFAGPALPGLYLVGDSTFPGQSTLAVAIGGARVAERITRGQRYRPRLPDPSHAMQ